jgi:hypothetical protein
MVNDDDDANVPAIPGKNPYEQYAEQTDTQRWLGALLKFTKGDYLVGRDAEECPETEVVALMQGMLHGWIRWEDNYPVDHKMGPLLEGHVPDARDKLGYLDEAQWEVDGNGKVRDPWQLSVYPPVISINAETVYTFATNSDGGRRRAIGPLCKEYGARIRQYPDEVPIVKLDQDSYMHPDHRIGRVKYPLFPVQRWVKAEPYLAAVMTLTGKSLKLSPPAAA